MILFPLIRLSGHRRSQETKWSSVSQFTHIPSHFAEDRRRDHDIDTVDLGQVRTGHGKQVRTQPELRFIAVLLLESCLPLLLRQAGALAAVLSPLEILFKLPIAFGHLLLAK